MTIHRDTVATVHSLSSERGSSLNGKQCWIEAYEPCSKRFICRFEDGGTMKLKDGNLTIEGRSDVDKQAYEIMPIVGKGYGVVARRRFNKFAKVIVETPVLESSFKDDHYHLDPVDIQSKLDALSQADKNAILQLSNYQTDANYDYTVENLKHHIRGIIETNVFGGKVDTRSRSMGGIALCLTIARINHSCTPNCEWRWNADIDDLPCVFAVREIQEGEELTLAYVLASASRQDRRSELKRYKFECRCEACKTTDQDIARVQIEETMMRRTADVDSLKQALNSMRSLGLSLPMYECMIHKQLSEQYMRKGDKEAALEAAIEAVVQLEFLQGNCSAITQDAKKTVKHLMQAQA